MFKLIVLVLSFNVQVIYSHYSLKFTFDQSNDGHREMVSSIIEIKYENKSLLASGSYDDTIKIWNLTSFKHIHTFNSTQLGGHNNNSKFEFYITKFKGNNIITKIISLQNDKLIASGSGDGSVKIWSLEKFDLKFSFLDTPESYGHSDYITSFVEIDNGNYLASGSADSTIRIWDLNNGSLRHAFKGHTNVISKIILIDSNILVSCSWDNTIKIWNITTLTLIYTFDKTNGGHSNRVNEVISFRNDDNLIASCSDDHTIKIWNWKLKILLKNLIGHQESVSKLLFLKNSNLASRSMDENIRIWSLNNFTCIKSFGRSLNGNFIEYMSDFFELSKNNYLISGSVENKLKIWDAEKEENSNLVDVLDQSNIGHVDLIRQMFVLSNGVLITAAWDNSIKIWQLNF